MISFCISMFKEVETVNITVKNIKDSFADCFVSVVQSECDLSLDNKAVDSYVMLPDCSKTVPHHKVPSCALSRNFSKLFSTVPSSDYIVALTGDTMICDATNATRRTEEMSRLGKLLYCSQAIGQNFHAANSDPANGFCGGRLQYLGISDFMPQYFVVDGKLGAFTDIEITNEYTSEQCLGDEFMKHCSGQFLENAMILSRDAYGYSDGVKYHMRKP